MYVAVRLDKPFQLETDLVTANNVEMAPLAQNAESFSAANPNSALDEISEINRGVDTIDRNLEQLSMLQQRSLDDADSSASSATNRQLDRLSSETMSQYRSLTERVRQLKSKPENQQRFGQQVRRVDSRLKDAIRAYQQVESSFRKKTEEQMARQYRIVRPDASEDEVRAAVEDETGGQVFQQALMQSNRRGQAQAVLNAVQDRHAQLQKIERQMIELAQLFQDMDTLVIQQEAAIVTIEQKGEEVVENLDKGNIEMGTAVNTARATRKKKWICLGIGGMSCPTRYVYLFPTNVRISCRYRRHCGHYCHLLWRHERSQEQQAKPTGARRSLLRWKRRKQRGFATVDLENQRGYEAMAYEHDDVNDIHLCSLLYQSSLATLIRATIGEGLVCLAQRYP